jgi:hypothetical protein
LDVLLNQPLGTADFYVLSKRYKTLFLDKRKEGVHVVNSPVSYYQYIKARSPFALGLNPEGMENIRTVLFLSISKIYKS